MADIASALELPEGGMMRQLNDEDYICECYAHDCNQLKAQHQQDIKDFIEWGEEECPHTSNIPTAYMQKHSCRSCWESLKQLAKE